MQQLTARTTFVTIGIVLLCASAVLYVTDRYGAANRVVAVVAPLQSLTGSKQLVENPSDAYRVWKSAGFTGRTVLFISDRWESFDPGELIPAQLFRAYPLQLYNTAKLLEDDHLNGTTFVYVASMNKIIRTIVALLPEDEVKRLADTARKSKFYKISDRGVWLSRQGVSRWYTTGRKFSRVEEPVLLYVGASYFKKSEPSELYRQLIQSGQRTDCLILCNERGKDTVTPREIAKLAEFGRLVGVAVGG